MYIAYVDESGNAGARGSRTFALGCVVVSANRWADVFNELISFRRFLRDSHGIPVRTELKANVLIRNGGPIRSLNLGDDIRYRIYRAHMRLHSKLGLRTFAIVIDKNQLASRGIDENPRDLAWRYLLQRLERMTSSEGQPVLLVHDEGDALLVRKMARKARRAGGAGSFFGSGWLARPFERLLDDPVARQSHQSYFLQLADLTAYAAYRNFFPPPPGPTPRIVPESMWQELGDARFKPVSSLKGGSPGLVLYPA